MIGVGASSTKKESVECLFSLFCEEGTFGAGKRLLLSWSAFSVQRFKVVSSLALSLPFQFYGMLISRESSALVFKLMLAVEEANQREKGARTV